MAVLLVSFARGVLLGFIIVNEEETDIFITSEPFPIIADGIKSVGTAATGGEIPPACSFSYHLLYIFEN